MSVFLGIDIGTSGTKTLAINPRGKILAEATSPYPSHHPKPLWSEQNPDHWWEATVKTVRAVVKQGKIKPADVKSIGLSGQMHGSVFLDKKNRVIRPAILWNDQRTAAECDEIEKRAGGRIRDEQAAADAVARRAQLRDCEDGVAHLDGVDVVQPVGIGKRERSGDFGRDRLVA